MINRYLEKYRWVSDTALDPLEIGKFQEKMENELRHEIKVDLEKSLSNRIYDFFMEKMTNNQDGDKRSFILMEESEIGELFVRSKLI